MDVLKSWVEAFTSAGIRLVFFFDGVVNEQKRQVWVRKETINQIFLAKKKRNQQFYRTLNVDVVIHMFNMLPRLLLTVFKLNFSCVDSVKFSCVQCPLLSTG